MENVPCLEMKRNQAFLLRQDLKAKMAAGKVLRISLRLMNVAAAAVDKLEQPQAGEGKEL